MKIWHIVVILRHTQCRDAMLVWILLLVRHSVPCQEDTSGQCKAADMWLRGIMTIASR
jgi:hypothetical protein